MDESSGREIRRLRSIFWSERDPDGRAFPSLADAYRRAGDLDQALELLDDGLGRHPDFATGHVVAAWVHRDRNDLPSAEAAFRRVLELDEENVQALHGLGKILVVRGEVAEAQRLLTRAAELGAATESDLAAGAIPSEEEGAGRASGEEEDAVEGFATDRGAAPPAAVDAALEGLPHTGMESSSLEPGALEVGADRTPSAGGTTEETTGQTIGEGAEETPGERIDERALGAAGEDVEPEVVEIDALAPDELVAEEDEGIPEPEAGPTDLDVVEIADLAPDPPVTSEDVGGGEPLDIDALAPDEEEPEPLDIHALAPDEEEPEPIDIDALAPDEEEPEPLDIDALAPDEEEPEPLGVDALAPDAPLPEEGPAEAPELEAAAPEAGVPEDHAPAPQEGPEEAADEVPEEAADQAPDEAAEEAADEALEEEEPVVAVGAEAFRAAADEPYEGPRTRTMAELYARQGLLDRAVDIYEHLVRERPEDREVRSRLDELRARRRGDQPGLDEDVEAMAREMSAGDHAESAPSPFTWAEEGGAGGGEALEDTEPEAEQSVSEWFEELLAWRPTARPQEDEPPPHGDRLAVPGEDR